MRPEPRVWGVGLGTAWDFGFSDLDGRGVGIWLAVLLVKDCKNGSNYVVKDRLSGIIPKSNRFTNVSSLLGTSTTKCGGLRCAAAAGHAPG